MELAPQTIEEYVYSIERLTSQHVCHPFSLRAWAPADMANAIVIELQREIAGFKGSQVVCVQFPADWWQAVKERWAPGWFRKRWPVEYIKRRWEAIALLPEVEIPLPHRRNSKIFIRELIGGA